MDANVDLTPPPPQRPPPVGAAASPGGGELAPRAPEVRAKAELACARDEAFPEVLAVPEASAAAEVELAPGVRELLVTSDSGRAGAALAWAIPAGPARALRLPLDAAASDDLEGMAWRGGRLYVLTSSGAARRFSPDGRGGLVRDQDAYAIAPPPLACADLRDGNCAANFEGLCLRATKGANGCDGYAASKAMSALYCVVLDGERVAIDMTKKPLALPLAHDALSDCAFGAAGGPAEGTLLVTTNVYDGSASYVVDEATGDLAPLELPPTLNNEAIAADRDGRIYTLMDDNGRTSGGYAFTCTGYSMRN